MIQVQHGKNARTTEYVIREMQTMAAICPARHTGQGSALKTKAVASNFWRTPGLPRVDACAAGRRRDVAGQQKSTRPDYPCCFAFAAALSPPAMNPRACVARSMLSSHKFLQMASALDNCSFTTADEKLSNVITPL